MNLDLLKNYNIFEGMTDEQIQVFTDILEHQELPENTNVFREGDLGKSIILLLDGEVKISYSLTLKITKSQIGKKEKALMRLHSENFPVFGEMTVFDDLDQRSATVTTTTQCVLGSMENEAVLQLCNEHPDAGFLFMKNIGKILSDRLRQANLDVKKLTTAFSLILED